MIRTVKFCESQHNALNGSSILIGNLQKYREIEKAEIVDDGEGGFDFIVDISGGAVVPNSWANLIFQGAIGFGDGEAVRVPGRVSAHIDSLHIEYTGEHETAFEHARAKIRYDCPNAFLFCTSMVAGDPKDENQFSSYDDFWEVAQGQGDQNRFATKLGQMIFATASAAYLESDLSHFSLAELQNMAIDVRHGPVHYVDREFLITKKTDQNFEMMIKKYLDVPFCKPVSYSKEKEYRFLFTPRLGDQIVPVKNKDLFVEVNVLKQK